MDIPGYINTETRTNKVLCNFARPIVLIYNNINLLRPMESMPSHKQRRIIPRIFVSAVGNLTTAFSQRRSVVITKDGVSGKPLHLVYQKVRVDFLTLLEFGPKLLTLTHLTFGKIRNANSNSSDFPRNPKMPNLTHLTFQKIFDIPRQ